MFKKGSLVTVFALIMVSFLAVFSGTTEAKKCLFIYIRHDRQNHTFNTMENLWEIRKGIFARMEARGVRKDWKVIVNPYTYKPAIWDGAHPSDNREETCHKLAVQCANFTGCALEDTYVMTISISDAYIRHTEFNHWRTGKLDLKDCGISLQSFVYNGAITGVNSHIQMWGGGPTVRNLQGDTDEILDATFRKAAVEWLWRNVEPTLLGPEEKKPTGNYIEEF